MTHIGIAILAYFLTDTLHCQQVLCEVRRNIYQMTCMKS